MSTPGDARAGQFPAAATWDEDVRRWLDVFRAGQRGGKTAAMLRGLDPAARAEFERRLREGARPGVGCAMRAGTYPCDCGLSAIERAARGDE